MIISIASQKGGTGKTSTSISLSAGLARKGKHVLLIDIDSQANSSKVLLPEYQKILKEQTIYTTIIERKPLPVHQTQVQNLVVAPSRMIKSGNGCSSHHLLPLRQRKRRQERQGSERQTEVPLPRLRRSPKLRGPRLQRLPAGQARGDH
jgi:chromosome partitioning protein